MDKNRNYETEQELKKQAYEEADRIARGGSSKKPHRKHATNYTPPKKRKKK